MRANRVNRFMELEGLRGLAAVIVVVFHVLLMLYPSIATSNMNGSPLFVFMYGTFSVMIFFVLSGFVLSIGFFQTKKLEIVRKLAAKRYLRLMLPALVSVLLAYVMLKLGLGGSREAAIAATNSAWLTNDWMMIPDLPTALYDGLIAAFIRPGGTPYNGVLWTMYYEFLGSFAVFVTLFIVGASRFRWLAYGLLIALLFNTWFLPLILGMILADIYNQGYLKKLFATPFLASAVFILGLFWGGYPIAAQGTLYNVFYIPYFSAEQNMMLYLTLGAFLVVSGLLYSSILSRIFKFRAVSLLGKYTYALYLTHLPVLYSVGTAVFVMFHGYMGYNRAAVLTVLVLIPIFTITTVLFYKFVDAPSVRLSSISSEVMLGAREIDMLRARTRLKGLTIGVAAFAMRLKLLTVGYGTKARDQELDVLS